MKTRHAINLNELTKAEQHLSYVSKTVLPADMEVHLDKVNENLKRLIAFERAALKEYGGTSNE